MCGIFICILYPAAWWPTPFAVKMAALRFFYGTTLRRLDIAVEISAGHLAGELFKMMAAVNLVHVPYRDNAPALTDLIAGQVGIHGQPWPEVSRLVWPQRAGQLR
jgi:Tripartite tricarboxylate transporter family receptor